MQTYFLNRVSFTEVAYDIMNLLNDISWEIGDYNLHIPFKPYDAVFYIGSCMNIDISRYYRYMFWSNRHIYYIVTEGPPLLSHMNIYALKKMTVISPSKYVKDELSNICDVVDIIPHCVPVKRIRSIPRNNLWRDMFKDKFIVLYVAHRNIRKGFRELCEAWLRSKASMDDNVVLLLHTSRQPNRLSGENYIIPEDGNIFVTDNIMKFNKDSLYMMYRSADLYVHAGLAEGFGIPIVEAISADVPVLTLDAPPMNEINRVKDACIKVERQIIYNDRGVVNYRLNIPDIHDYVEKLEAMIYDKSLREEVRSKQQEYIDEYDISNYNRFRRYLKNFISQ